MVKGSHGRLQAPAVLYVHRRKRDAAQRHRQGAASRAEEAIRKLNAIGCSIGNHSQMQAVLNSALPIFALILTGFICGYFGVFDRTATDNLNRFAVYLALPSLMFVAMSKITPDQVRQFGFVGAFCGGFSVCFAVAFLISRLRGRRVANASIEGLDAGYSNVGFMGIPMCLLVFGPESAPASIIATLFTACVLFLFAVIVVEIDLRKGDRFWLTVGKTVSSLLRSPLLIAPVAGLAVGLSGLRLPAPLESFTTLLGGAASPAALVCIGLFLAQE